MPEIIHHLRGLLLHHDPGATDDQLLAKFIGHNDGSALAALMARHGPMMWGVCRRILGHHQDTEDAFQAVFLVLVRNAKIIFPKAMISSWLHSVAYRTALAARKVTDQRKKHERQVEQMPQPQCADSQCLEEWLVFLDQEMNRLPKHYHEVVVRCDLEGETLLDVAQQLAVSQWTLASRLKKARALLARRLARRGISLSVAPLVGALGQQAASARMRTALARSTINAASCFAAGQALREI